tara:strand:+ start:8380 stop:8760 length:381 start_codon:yes stop_codon:yes gene_type:complete
MAMQMQRAFNARMLSKLTLYVAPVPLGTYDEFNDWTLSPYVETTIYGVVVSGNKFSQFEEGQAIRVEDGGQRTSDYRSLYVTDKYPVNIGDKLFYKGFYFNVLQRSDESAYGFYSILIEKSEEWTP